MMSRAACCLMLAVPDLHCEREKYSANPNACCGRRYGERYKYGISHVNDVFNFNFGGNNEQDYLYLFRC